MSSWYLSTVLPRSFNSCKKTIIILVIILSIKVEGYKSTLLTNPCENCIVFPSDDTQRFGSNFRVQVKPVELNITITEVRKDRVFGLDSAIFEKYLENFDWSIYPGFREDDDFENWIVPDVIKENIAPNYMSGFDKQNRPIWVMDYGKHNFKKFTTGGPELRDLFFKYIRYTVYVARKSMALRSTDKHRVTQIIWIADFEGVTPESLLDPEALKLQLKVMSDSRRYTEAYLNKIIGLNVNLVSENLLNLARFFLFSLLDRFFVYGTNKAWWVPQLLKILPKESIPEKYGGAKGFKPLYFVH